MVAPTKDGGMAAALQVANVTNMDEWSMTIACLVSADFCAVAAPQTFASSTVRSS